MIAPTFGCSPLSGNPFVVTACDAGTTAASATSAAASITFHIRETPKGRRNEPRMLAPLVRRVKVQHGPHLGAPSRQERRRAQDRGVRDGLRGDKKIVERNVGSILVTRDGEVVG